MKLLDIPIESKTRMYHFIQLDNYINFLSTCVRKVSSSSKTD